MEGSIPIKKGKYIDYEKNGNDFAVDLSEELLLVDSLGRLIEVFHRVLLHLGQ